MFDPARQPTRVLLTGAGGPAAISFLRSLTGHTEFEFYMADMDPLAQGLYLVPEARRLIILPGAHPDFASSLLEACVALRIDVLVPTVDVELLPVARHRARFEKAGIKLLLPTLESLLLTMDKQALIDHCDGVAPVPTSTPYGEDYGAPARFPVLIKPRSGSGSRGIQKIEDAASLGRVERSSELLIQEYLPGDEYSVDVVTDSDGTVLAAVPRSRMKVDSGVAVVARTLKDEELIDHAIHIVEHVGLTGIVNVQMRRDRFGVPKLLEINPRVPGTISLTIAAGVHMPWIALLSVLDVATDRSKLVEDSVATGSASHALMPFEEIAVVRHLAEVFLDPAQLDAMMLETMKRVIAA